MIEGGQAARPEPASRELMALLDRCTERCRLRSGAPAPWTLLVMTLTLRIRGFEVGDAVARAIAARTDADVERVRDAARFTDLVLASGKDEPATMTLCRGTSCSLNGAERVHALIRELVEEGGLPIAFREVFCLGQCDYGPSLMVGGSIYLVRARRVVEDRRDWRQGDGGPIAIGDATVPVLD